MHHQIRTLSIVFCVAHIEKEREQGLNPGEKSKNARGVAVITQKDLAKQLDVYQKDLRRWYLRDNLLYPLCGLVHLAHDAVFLQIFNTP